MKDLDLEYNLVKENALTKTSSSPHYPLCCTVCNASNCTPWYSCSSSNELDYGLTQGSEVIHDENENKSPIKYPFNSSSFPILHKEISLVQVTHDIFPKYASLDVQLEESYDLGNLSLEYAQFDQISDVDGFHPNNSDLMEITGSNFPHTMHDLNPLLQF